MRIIDTHGHLYLPEFENDLGEVVRRAQAEGVVHTLLPNIDSGTTHILKRTISTFPDFFSGMTGIHPTSVKHDYQKELDHFESEISSGFPWCGVGEIGIDLYWDKTFFENQKIVFNTQMEIAAQSGLPVSIHQRSAMKETLEIMSRFKGKVVGALHCFSGDIEDAKAAIDLGYKLGISGVMTFKNSNLREVVTYTGIQHLVLETDAPYLAPMPFRGKRNEPAYLKYVVILLAQTLGIDANEVGKITSQNALEIFQT